MHDLACSPFCHDTAKGQAERATVSDLVLRGGAGDGNRTRITSLEAPGPPAVSWGFVVGGRVLSGLERPGLACPSGTYLARRTYALG